MPKKDLRGLVEDAKAELDGERRGFEKSVQDELASSKKRTLDKI